VGSSHARARVPGDLNVSGRPVTGSDHEVFVGLNSWELDLWGRVRSLDEAALQQYLATAAGARATSSACWARWRAATWRCASWTNACAWRAAPSPAGQNRCASSPAAMKWAAPPVALTQVQSLHNQALSLAVSLEQERAQIAHSLAQLTGQPTAQLANCRPCRRGLRVPRRAGGPALGPAAGPAGHRRGRAPAAGRPRPGGRRAPRSFRALR
jgi:hypothetical protein